MENPTQNQTILSFVHGKTGLSSLVEIGINPVSINGGISWGEVYCPDPLQVVKRDIAEGLLKQTSAEAASLWAKFIIGSGFLEFKHEDEESEPLWDCVWDISEGGISPNHRQLAEKILNS